MSKIHARGEMRKRCVRSEGLVKVRGEHVYEDHEQGSHIGIPNGLEGMAGLCGIWGQTFLAFIVVDRYCGIVIV